MAMNHTGLQQEQQQAAARYQQYLQQGDHCYKAHLDVREAGNMLDKTLNEYAKALELEPASPQLLAKMARTILKQGNHNKAEQMAKKALKLDNRLSDAWHVLGYLDYKNHRYPESCENLRRAVRHGGLAAGRSRLCLYHAYQQVSNGKSLLQKLSLKAKAAWQAGIATLLFGFETDRLRIGDIARMIPVLLQGYLQEEKRDWNAALKLYMRLHERLPGLPSLSNTIGMIYRKKNHADEALFWFRKTIARHPNNESAYFQVAQILEEKNDLEKASQVYNHLLTLCPKDPHVHCSLGNVYFSNNEYELALSHYKAALMLCKDPIWRALVAQSIGNLYVEQFGNFDAAQQAFQIAMDLNPKDVESYIQLGLIYFKNKEFQNARLIYEEAIRVSPKNPRLYSNLGYLRWMEGDIEEGEQFYKKAIELDPYYEIPYNNLGVIYLDSLGRVPQAVELLEKAVSLNDSYALAFYNLGRAYSFLDEKLLAANCFHTAQKLNTYTKELDNEELVARINHLFSASECGASSADSFQA